jgi:hypothetical protein
MITLDEAEQLASAHLVELGFEHEGCVYRFPFPDGTVTLHFARPRFFTSEDGSVIEEVTSSYTVMVDRTDSSVWIPGRL